MPGKPLILAARLTAHPSLFEVARKDDAQRGGANPGSNHEGTMQTHQQLATAAELLYNCKIDRATRGQASNVVIANAILLKAAAGGN